MLLLTFFLSFTLILIGKYNFPFLNPSPAVRKAMIIIGMFGLGFFFGFKLFHAATNFATGFSDGLAGRAQAQ